MHPEGMHPIEETSNFSVFRVEQIVVPEKQYRFTTMFCNELYSIVFCCSIKGFR